MVVCFGGPSTTTTVPTWKPQVVTFVRLLHKWHLLSLLTAADETVRYRCCMLVFSESIVQNRHFRSYVHYFLLPCIYFVCEVFLCNVLNSGLFKGHCFGNGIKASWAHWIYTSRCLWQVEFQEGPPWPLHHSSVYAQYNLLLLRVWASQMALTVKNPPPMQETWVWSPD